MTNPLSVVIAARNAEHTIREQVAALTSQPWPHGGEIIIADNGSTDATARIVAEAARAIDPLQPITIRLIDCAEQPGAGYARNVGVRESQHQHIAFCDADDVVSNTWIAEMGRALSNHRAVGGRVELDTLNPPTVSASRGTGHSAGLPYFDEVFPVLSSCNLGIHRSTFDELGGFDETFLRGQDAELSLRLFDRGVEAHYAADAVVHYRLRTSLRAIFAQARGWGEVNARLRRRLSSHPRWRTSLRSWIWLVARIDHLASPTKRARWVYIAGLRVGLLASASRHRFQQLRNRRFSWRGGLKT